MPVCMVLVKLAITCVHDYMVVTVKVTKIYGKMNFNRLALAITAVPTINWCPVIVSNRQQVSPILSLAVISLLIDQ